MSVYTPAQKDLSTDRVNYECIKKCVLSFLQPDSLIPDIDIHWYSMHIALQIASSVFEKYYWIFVDFSNKGYQLLFTSSQTISMENLNGKQNLRPEKGICSYLVKFFYCAIDTVYVEYTGLFFVSLLCPCFSCAATLWNKSRARIWPLIIWFDHNAC